MIPTPARKNSEIPKSLKLHQIAKLVGGTVVGDGETAITGAAGIREARVGEITFLANPKYLPFLEQTQASAVITAENVSSDKKNLVHTPHPSSAFTKVLSLFLPSDDTFPAGVHPTAVVHPSVSLGESVGIGPHVVIEENASVGDRSVIMAGTFVGRGSSIGSRTLVYPNVTIREKTEIGDRVIIHSGAVIGSDGFGYETLDDVQVKIPQLGSVRIGDDVEIGANVCIDRGRFQKTWIKEGVKIDNLVQIAHNVVIGPHSLIVAQVGISGSTELGKNVVVAGQAGIIGHVTVGDKAVIGARSGVSKSVPPGGVVLGEPARPIAEQKRIFALIARLPELFKDLADLKNRLKG